MKVVLLESLGISEELLRELSEPLLRAGHDFSVYSKTEDESTLIKETKEADVIMLANMPLNGNVIRACKQLKFIDIAFTGVDHVDLNAAKDMGVNVSNAAGYSTESVAELVIGQMISLLRHIPETEKRCRTGKTKEGLVGRELSNCTVGIIGTGAIGCRVAELCKSFGSRVLGFAPRPKTNARKFLDYVSLEELLSNSDIVTLHCPLTNETKGMIGMEELSMMRKNAYLINMARGPIVDTSALVEVLQNGSIAGAAIDVFDSEPPLSPDYELLHAPNCYVTPHIAFASRESMELRAKIVFDSLYHWMEGNQINKIF